MKTITYRGEEYVVEDWVNFLATEANGDIWGYEFEPEFDEKTGWRFSNGRVAGVEFFCGWENSLEKV